MGNTVNKKRRRTLKKKTRTNKNIILIILLIAIAGSIYYFKLPKSKESKKTYKCSVFCPITKKYIQIV